MPRLPVYRLLGVALLVLSTTADAAPRKKKFFHTTPPDLTSGGKPDDSRDWRLGPIGASGWVFHRRSRQGASALARQVLVTGVDEGGPAAGKLQLDDVITGVAGKPFSRDARKALAAAIDEAEKDENKGRLELAVWRKGKTVEVTVTLPVMGSYSETMPFRCPKTDKIVDNACKYVKQHEDLLKPGWLGWINGLGLLATGWDDVMPMVRTLAHASCLKDGETLSVEKHVPMKCWDWSYRTLFLCEYYLRTKDEAVLPTITEYATKIAMGQSGAGTWGHTYAARENAGHLHGHLGGYGAINQMGLTLMIVLPLVEKCGVTNDEIAAAIKRGDDFFSYFIGKGTIPYGDHGAANEWFDDNGKSGSAAIFFDLMGNREGAQFFSELVLGSASNGREEGHTGCYWSHLWGGIGALRGGELGLQTFFKEMNWAFTLERQPNGRMVFQGNAGEAGEEGDPKTKWNCTGARLLQLCAPRRVLYITGKTTPKATHLTRQRIDRILEAGRLDADKTARASLELPQILDLLKDPLPAIRSVGARTLAERDINCVDRLVEMLESENRYARYGAAEALSKAGFGSRKAADKLISLMATDSDVTFQVYAIAALINRDKERGLLSVAKPAIPVLLKMAVKHSPDDPRRVLQHDIGRALFYNGRAQPRRGLLVEYGLDDVDRSLLFPAIKEILTNENGWARSTLSWVYKELPDTELEQLWGDIYRATREIAPSGIMFASGVRMAGLKLMAEHRVKEGLDLAAWYVRYQKDHGKGGRMPQVLEILLQYGAHAKRVILELEKHARYWETKRNPRKTPGPEDLANQVRATIRKIEAIETPPEDELISIAGHILPPAAGGAEKKVRTTTGERVTAPVIEEAIVIDKIWSAVSVRFCLLTHGNRQYVAYYNADRRMVVGMRELSEPSFTKKILPSESGKPPREARATSTIQGWDSHNYITMAVDKRGHIHLSGNMHVDPLLYFRTEKPGDITTMKQVKAMVGKNESRCTYPKFMESPNGDLAFHYRDGSSGAGAEIYNIYDAGTGKWRRFFDTPLITGFGKRNAYQNGPRLGPDGWYHLAWMWRETGDAATNHDISYARSRDLLNWENAAGEPLTLPLTIESKGTIVDPVPVNGGMINSCFGFGFDSRNRVVVTYHKHDKNGNTQGYAARFDNGAWLVKAVSDWEGRHIFKGGGSGPSTFGTSLRVGTILRHGEGRLAVPFSHWKAGSGLLVIDEETLERVGVEPKPRSAPRHPPELTKVKSDFPGMRVKWCGDSGKAPDASARYALRWETLGSNRDRPRKEPLPANGELVLYKLGRSSPL